MIAIHTTAISLPSEGKTSGGCCPNKVSSDHNTGQITLKFHFYAVWVFVNSPQKKKVENSKFHFFDLIRGLSPVMATIRCTDVADSAQFAAKLRNRGGRSFLASDVASLLELLRKPGHPFGKSSGEGALNSECSSYYKRINALWQLHPGMTRSFFFCGPLKKEWSATNEGKR